jgi:(p)ppGpp synthase/HD superfamily hydrolase
MIEHDRLADALALAHEAHRTQKRKGTDILTHGGSEDQAIAALLHDVIEDAGEAHAGRIHEAFGPDVLAMVRDCTDGSFENSPLRAHRKRSSPTGGRASWPTSIT